MKFRQPQKGRKRMTVGVRGGAVQPPTVRSTVGHAQPEWSIASIKRVRSNYKFRLWTKMPFFNAYRKERAAGTPCGSVALLHAFQRCGASTPSHSRSRFQYR